jgi:hypothetical protein
MQKQQTSILKLSLLVSALGLYACGGSGSDNASATPEQPAKPLVSSFSSSLTLQDEGQPMQAIASRTTTDDKDSTLAYRVSTSLSNSRTISMGENRVTASFPQVSKTFSFQLGNDPAAPILDILYDTLTRKVIDITLRRDRESPLPNTSTCDVDDQFKPAFSCQGVTFSEITDNGKFSVTFNNTILRKTANASSHVHTVTLNGKLAGELSIAPLALKDIPQTSSGNIVVNGKPLKAVAASYNNYSRGFRRTGLTALLEDGSGIYFAKYPNGAYESSYILSDPAGLIARPETITQLSLQSTTQSDTFQLGTTRFNFDAPMSGETPAPLTISGSLSVPKPVQQFSYSPVVPVGIDGNSYWYGTNSPLRYSYIPEGISITLTNHNQVQLESNGFTAIVKDKKIQSINYESLLMNADPPEFVVYSCGKNSPPCQGTTVTADGFGILLNNTKLVNNDKDAVELPAAITLNGGLVYPGR